MILLDDALCFLDIIPVAARYKRSFCLPVGVITVDAVGLVSVCRDSHVDLVGQVAFKAVAAVLTSRVGVQACVDLTEVGKVIEIFGIFVWAGAA